MPAVCSKTWSNPHDLGYFSLWLWPAVPAVCMYSSAYGAPLQVIIWCNCYTRIPTIFCSIVYKNSQNTWINPWKVNDLGSGMLRWWMGHCSKPVDTTSKRYLRWRTCTFACSFELREYDYSLLPGSRQVTWLPCLSLCSWLISSAAYLSEWLSSTYECVWECAQVTDLLPHQDIANAQWAFCKNYLNLIFALETDIQYVAML